MKPTGRTGASGPFRSYRIAFAAARAWWLLAAATTAVCVLMLGSATSRAADANDYPVRPLRFVVGFTPGGSSDTVARIVGQRLGERLGQQVVIDNRGGASGGIAAELVAKSRPDG
jgi:tripartite-type tricarboxylate transporter receptor subunit TctC